ncbi:MAG: hypothetical protein QNJ37_08005 [Crocosphaera sp.]|nr:hypothetical protein [Crocosphaera sp.]
MNLTKLLPLIKKNNPNSGATLLEILLGSALMSFIVGIAGFGLVHILSVEQKASAKGEIQANSNRALEFLTDEIKLGRRIESDAVAALAEAPDFTLPSGAKPILVFQVPDVPQRIVYYTKPAENIWEGPNVLERWGPPMDENGQYDPAEINNPENWEYHVLIDSIDDTAQTPNCSPDWRPSNVDATQGFNACVNPEEKLVKLNLATTTTNKTWREDVNYQVQSMAFARSNITQGFTGDAPIFEINNKQLTIPKPANVKFEVLGGAITCGAGGVNIPVTTYLYKDDTKQVWDTSSALSLSNQPAGTTFDVESIKDEDRTVCNKEKLAVSSTDSDSPRIRVLVNGDPVPDVTPFDNQTTIDDFLEGYIEDGKIKLAENQAIYLFELGSNSDTGSATFDLQDNVVLATVDSVN